MSAHTQTIRVRISPGVRMWQAAIVAAAVVLSLVIGFLIGRMNAPAAATTGFDRRDFSAYACTGHVPNSACRQPAEVGYVSTGHVPPGGFDSAYHG